MYSQEFVSLVMGDRSMYPIPFDKNGGGASIETEAKQLLDHGYTISNLMDLKSLTPEQVADFYTSFKPEVKSGYILRKGFADSKEFKEYSEEEWRVIFAQYSITYGWTGEYRHNFGDNAHDVIDAYNTEQVTNIQRIMEHSKTITVIFRADTVKLIREIMESPVVLRAHQIKTLEACPSDVLVDAWGKANITIRETLIKIIQQLSKTGIKGLFKFPTDVLRYIIAAYAHTPFEGQITKPDLKDRKVKIPTSARKWLMGELDSMGNAQYICEDMFTYEAYWKLMHRYLRFGKAVNARKRFVNYHKAIDLLYDGDRSWTFNGRYSVALSNLDYAKALDVAKERPGFMMRNLMNFLRYPTGTEVAKAETVRSGAPSLNPMATKPGNGKVLTDNIDFFGSIDFSALISNSNSKLAFQLLEQLGGKAIRRDQSIRVVQGITKRYSVPIPGIKKQIAKKVSLAVEDGIRMNLSTQHKDAGMVYISPELEDVLLQYSGRTSTELNYSGTMLTPGSKIDIPDTKILRVGVLWRGKMSTDIDHNAVLFSGNQKIVDVYFGNPVYQNLVNSSGDITHCDAEAFSAEFIDIDMTEIFKTDITSIITSLISYSGKPRTIGSTECYLFIKGLDAIDRTINDRMFTLDLQDTDYATRLDPDNKEDSTDYVGFNIELDEGKIQVCAYTAQEDGAYNTIRQRDYSPEFLEGIFGSGYTLFEALHLAFSPAQITLDKSKADLVFGEDGIDPGTELEQIHNYIF